MEETVVNERERLHAEEMQREGEPIRTWWYKDNILLSLFLNAGSAGIPDAERFVYETVQEAAAQHEFPDLGRAIQNIIHEEMAHSRVHDAYNEYVRATGLDIDGYIEQGRRILAFLKRRCSLKTRLAIASTIEHFTASMAKQVLDVGLLEGEDVDERMDRVWTWHALEEIDHRETVFDVYQAMGGGFVRRVCAALLATGIFLYMQPVGVLSFMRQRGVLWNLRVWRTGLPLLFGRKGVYRHLLIDWLRLFWPTFRPTDIPISNQLQKQLHHYHVESELISYFKDAAAARAA